MGGIGCFWSVGHPAEVPLTRERSVVMELVALIVVGAVVWVAVSGDKSCKYCGGSGQAWYPQGSMRCPCGANSEYWDKQPWA
jgi:hypothetical protein